MSDHPSASPSAGGEHAALPATGHPRVDEAIAALARVQDAPPAEQVEPLAHAHRSLAETLDTIGDV